ncbi:hypothetical protein [Ruegeria sp. HKCCA5929]|uniref:hypothetical protein n=1 Tax=Ruegeria sp. HKCCA5929 TaxID=2682988 RepID=UPI001489DD43|nr:hypothetical protein [Ruegeria sp. HKCCA5929]
MTNENNPIDFGAFTEPKKRPEPVSAPEESKKEKGRGERQEWVSRQPAAEPVAPQKATEGQISIKGPDHIIERFKQLCKDDRRVYYDMLEILMDKFEGK